MLYLYILSATPLLLTCSGSVLLLFFYREFHEPGALGALLVSAAQRWPSVTLTQHLLKPQ